jgi:hypothetical protein
MIDPPDYPNSDFEYFLMDSVPEKVDLEDLSPEEVRKLCLPNAKHSAVLSTVVRKWVP